jgi:hypothetical protein
VGDARKEVRNSEEAARATKVVGSRRERNVSSEEAARAASGWLSWMCVCVFGTERCVTWFESKESCGVNAARVSQATYTKRRKHKDTQKRRATLQPFHVLLLFAFTRHGYGVAFNNLGRENQNTHCMRLRRKSVGRILAHIGTHQTWPASWVGLKAPYATKGRSTM